jgi:hypothetical protein
MGSGPVTTMTLPTRAQIARQRKSMDQPIRTGSHYTLRYRQTDTNEEHFSSVAEILQWIAAGPLLQPPTTLVSQNLTDAPITAPPYVPATIQFVPHESQHPNPALPATTIAASIPVALGTLIQRTPQREQRVVSHAQPNAAKRYLRTEQRVPPDAQKRVSERAQGINRSHLTRKQYRSDTSNQEAAMFLASCFTEYKNTSATIPFDYYETSRLSELNENTFFGSDGISRLSGLNERIPLDVNTTLGLYGWNSAAFNKIACLAAPTGSVNSNTGTTPSFAFPRPPPGFEHLTIDEDADRFRQLCDNDMAQDHSHLLKPMPPSTLSPIFPHGPLNLNPDGTTINNKKSHAGPNVNHWIQADAEEMARLFNTGTIRPIRYSDIPRNTTVTYVNPICVEKLNDDGSLKLRTRITSTIGGDRINYPFETRVVTAEMEALKILLNCMISENGNWTTIDLTDFYLGTDLPHPEYIRVKSQLIPNNVTEFYKLRPFMDRQNPLRITANRSPEPTTVI